jgi:hypothetical protein
VSESFVNDIVVPVVPVIYDNLIHPLPCPLGAHNSRCATSLSRKLTMGTSSKTKWSTMVRTTEMYLEMVHVLSDVCLCVFLLW